MNIDADYVQSQNDIRTPAKSYNRLTAQIGYSNVFNPQGRAFSLNAKLKGLTTLDKQKSDPDKQSEEKTKVENQEISLNIYGNWMINKAWLTSLKSVSYTHLDVYKRQSQWRVGVGLPH